MNVSRRPQITGVIESLPNREILSTTFADLYLHKNPKGGLYSDYDLLLINKDHKQWPEGATVKFTIQTPSQNSQEDDLYEYELPILSEFYRTGVFLKRRQNRLFLTHKGQETELNGELLPSNAVPGPAQVTTTWSLLPTAYAQTGEPAFSSYDFTVGLESPDAIVRRKTRYALSLQDQEQALPWMNSVLKDKTSSYRLRDEALRLARRYKLIPVTVYEHYNFAGKSQAYGPGTYRYDKARLGDLPNDSASSLRVAKGFSVRLCEHEGDDGKGSGLCEVKGAGNHDLHLGTGRLADKVSFIRVFTLKKVE